MKIIVTESIASEGIDFLREKGCEVDVRFGIPREELLSIIADYDALIVRSVTKVNEELFARGKNLKVVGGSMGGMQSIWAAALDPAVTEAKPCVPWNCDMGGRDTLKRNINSWYIKESPALRYYDPVNLAKRIGPKCRVEITRAGFGDYCCPPSGVSVLYNNLKCPKKINWVQGSTHGYVPSEEHQHFSLESDWK